jgi:hypothetical protein
MVTQRSFLVRGTRFAVGQAADLWVCVAPNGAIASVQLKGSSGEARFDQFALNWARQADVSHWVTKRQKQSSCGSVRVEIGRGKQRQIESGIDTALG